MKFKLSPRHGLKHRVATTGISSLNPKTFTIFYFDDGRIAINGQYSKSACEQWLSYRPEPVSYNVTSYLDKWNRSNIRRELKKIDNMLNLASGHDEEKMHLQNRIYGLKKTLEEVNAVAEIVVSKEYRLIHLNQEQKQIVNRYKVRLEKQKAWNKMMEERKKEK